ncbi:MAG: hypothetical protein A2020_02915 [Lentisphaerae bacterium GWF2_45_14]|nr:MAG: hypothetical protein A2020_02915 [Lentisphaerae bacterium GWF2_45_14]
MIFAGIITGVIAAFMQSCSYLASRFFLSRHMSPMGLFILSHITMGLISLVMLPFFFPENPPPFSKYVLPLCGMSFFYMGGQLAFFRAIKYAEASRVSPLLGIKAVILTVLSSVFLGCSYTYLQWLSVFLCVSSAFVLNWSGGSMPIRSIMWTFAACFGYSLSDLSIKSTVDCFPEMGIIQRSLLSVFMCYLICGFTGLCLLFFFRRNVSYRAARDSLPFSILWMGSMFFLFTCFAQIGPVFGNIIQSSRGIISIVIGLAAASLGFVALEQKTSGSVFTRRLVAAVMMTLAICMFYYGAK